MATTKTRPNRVQFLQALIDHERTSPEERQAAERAMVRVLAAQKAAGAGTAGGNARTGLPIWYGPKYDRKLTATEIAAMIRQDIKLARKLAAKAGPDDGEGALKVPSPIGDAPAEIKFSVRSRHGSAITITAQNVSPEWAWTTRDHNGHPMRVKTEAAAALAVELRAVGNAYNFDGSDVSADYFHKNYYLTLRVESTDGQWGNV